MNQQSCDCRRVAYGRQLAAHPQPGDFCWADERENGMRVLYICLPGQKVMDAFPVKRGPPGAERVWGWDGNEERPTLEPSLLYEGHWHGHLRSGHLQSC